MRRTRIVGLTWLLWSLCCLAADAQPSIVVEGLDNHGLYADRAQFRVLPQQGYDISCRLDNLPVATGIFVDVTEVNYHELSIQRRPTGSDQLESTNIQFIVRSSERGYTELGLPPWTPYPVINAGAAQFEGLQLNLVIPAQFPQHLPMPVIALLEHPDGRPAWQNGVVTGFGNEATPLQLRRGFGSRLLPPSSNPGTLLYRGQLHSLETSRQVTLETNTAWTMVSGSLTGAVVWPENARIFLTNDLEIGRDASLNIGAGALIKIGSLANITLNGRCEVQGTRERPVVFMPDERSKPWGGFLATNSAAVLTMNGAILTGGGGDPDYFTSTYGISHRMEQAVLLLSNGARASLTNCYFIDNAGQMGNSYDATLTLDHCLVQRCITAGQFNGGAVNFNRSALIEFPQDTPVFADADEDALYFKFGGHSIKGSVIGWTRDDGIDAILGEGETVTIDNCWFESCFHEATAWSGYAGTGDIRRTVILNCGQGIEDGYSLAPNGPNVYAEQLVCLGNLVGARYGDNYNWGYAGFLRVTNSFLLHNVRDVWGMTWQSWQYRADAMDIRDNVLSATNAWHPVNRAWDPLSDAWRLTEFMPGLADRPVGIAFALRYQQSDLSQLSQGVSVGLSSFAAQSVSVDYCVEGVLGVLERGRLEFAPGETIKTIYPARANLDPQDIIQIALSNPQNSELTGWPRIVFARPTSLQPPKLFGTRSGDGLFLVWTDSSFVLEGATGLQGPWNAVGNASSPATLDAADSSRFFRLRK
jgi:hypothetical protein